MKTVFCIILLVGSTISLKAQWVAQTSKTTNSLLGIAYPSKTVGYSCGLNGTILKTVNGGYSWQITKSTIQTALYATVFANTDTGIAVGDNGMVVLTENTGLDWAISPTNLSKAWRFCK